MTPAVPGAAATQNVSPRVLPTQLRARQIRLDATANAARARLVVQSVRQPNAGARRLVMALPTLAESCSQRLRQLLHYPHLVMAMMVELSRLVRAISRPVLATRRFDRCACAGAASDPVRPQVDAGMVGDLHSMIGLDPSRNEVIRGKCHLPDIAAAQNRLEWPGHCP